MTDDDAVDTFDRQAADYDRQRRRLIPPFDAFYAAAVEGLELAGRPLEQVLDLGSGTGLLSRRVADHLPDADLTLLDGAPAMLRQARASLGDRPRYLIGNLSAPLPDGPWDAVVSALAIHHLDDPGKRELFGRLHDAIAPGGVFVNAEQVAGPTPLLQERYAAWHQAGARAAGATPAEWAASVDRMRFDRWATVEQQLEWLRAAGFGHADCLFKDHCFAVLVARH